jgi:hypothetical protein
MIQCYELIDVRIKNEMIQARPVAWDREICDGFGNDSKGVPVNSTEFHATCPFCGNLVHFAKTDIYSKDNIKCLECGAGNTKVEEDEVVVSTTPSAPKVVQPKRDVFQDPIESGLFDVDVDHELLERLESAESN